MQESERLTRLINDILDLAKMEAGKTEWQMLEIAPKQVIDNALAAMAGLLAKNPHIRFETHIAGDLPNVFVDADRLTQVLVNLISNAVKFCNRDNGLISITARPEGTRSASMSATTASASPRRIAGRCSSASSRRAIR